MRPKIGVALSSGGARGFAHLGVLRVLREEGIPIDAVSGSSMGALVAVLLAGGLDLDWCCRLASHLPRKTWLDFQMPGRGFIAGRRVLELLRMLTRGKRLEDLELPVAVVATDLVRGEPVIFTEGPAAEAVRASISIPGVFEPVDAGDRLLVDGGVTQRVPVDVLREMGMDLVIAVDVMPAGDDRRVETMLDVILRSLEVMERERARLRATVADFVFRPDVSGISPGSFSKAAECILRGQVEAQAQIGRLKRIIENWRNGETDDEIPLAE
ncbi:patatin-like phospholipase family protein [Staphylospora marina]|uniref:patatin-like phospholipase family protein n=1 Tax=Staphylospora marina TaxID=2490858 RepID=UPI000F5BAC8E|nr:patatin-like phospholipase family protein [Staphylospora marina]